MRVLFGLIIALFILANPDLFPVIALLFCISFLLIFLLLRWRDKKKH